MRQPTFDHLVRVNACHYRYRPRRRVKGAENCSIKKHFRHSVPIMFRPILKWRCICCPAAVIASLAPIDYSVLHSWVGSPLSLLADEVFCVFKVRRLFLTEILWWRAFRRRMYKYWRLTDWKLFSPKLTQNDKANDEPHRRIIVLFSPHRNDSLFKEFTGLEDRFFMLQWWRHWIILSINDGFDYSSWLHVMLFFVLFITQWKCPLSTNKQPS